MRAGRALQGLGALLVAAGIAVGALGAHLLKGRLPVDRYAVLETAVLYQLVSALGLLYVGLALEHAVQPATRRLLRHGGRLLLAGTLLFAGSLYLLLAGAPRWLGPLTPLGGLALIAGWLLVAVAQARSARRD